MAYTWDIGGELPQLLTSYITNSMAHETIPNEGGHFVGFSQ